jgi:hypothetical protein
MVWAPAGYLITGILLGQGMKFGVETIQKISNARNQS